VPRTSATHHLFRHINSSSATWTRIFRAIFSHARCYSISIAERSDVSLRYTWNVGSWWSVDVSSAIIHAEDSGPASVAVTFGPELFAVTRFAEELVVVFGRIRAIQLLPTIGALEAHLVERFAQGDFLFGKVHVLGTSRADSGHCAMGFRCLDISNSNSSSRGRR